MDERFRLREDLVPISALQTGTSRVVREVETSGRPKVITRDGVAVAVLIRVDQYESLWEDAAIGGLLRDIRQGGRDLEEGRGIPSEEVFRKLEEKYGPI